MRFENRLFLIIVILFVAAFAAHAIILGKTVYGDGIYYFSWLRSAVMDRNLDFRNEYSVLGGAQPLTAAGLPGNKYAVGPALLWTPAYLMTATFAGGNGMEFPYQAAVGLTGVLAAVAGLILLYDALVAVYSRTAAAAAVFATAFATNLFFYGALDTVNSHAASFFAASVFLAYLVRLRKAPGYVAGILTGLLFLMRPQDAVYVLLLVPFLTAASLVPVAVGFLAAILPQLSAWGLLYGRLSSPYLTGNEGFSFLSPHITGALFSPSGGLLPWTPVLAIGIAGTILMIRRPRRPWFRAIPVVLAVHLYVIASWSTWWQGASYGSRMFVSMLPLFALGMAEVFSRLFSYRMRLRHLMLLLVGPLSVLNAVFIVYFLARN